MPQSSYRAIALVGDISLSPDDFQDSLRGTGAPASKARGDVFLLASLAAPLPSPAGLESASDSILCEGHAISDVFAKGEHRNTPKTWQPPLTV